MAWIENGPTELLLAAHDFHQYAYGLEVTVQLAHKLGVPQVSILELGVAGGNGLVEMERLAGILSSTYDVEIDLHGFDLGVGMPSTVDYRDAPYIWRRGFFDMNEGKLRRRLTRAELHLGDVANTGREFLASSPAPIGFVSFDLDYYSSTSAALASLMESGQMERYLPRVVCYFDDTVGTNSEVHCQFVGEMLAINEFNMRNSSRKLDQIHGLRYKLLPIEGSWIEGIYVLHIFDHPLYNTYVFPEPDRQFPLI